MSGEKSCKVGILTFHFPYNCGALLQCAALQTVLTREGADVKIVNYRPWYHRNRYTPFKNPVYFAGRRMSEKVENDNGIKKGVRGLKGFVKTVMSWKNYKRMMPQEKKFKSFEDRFLKETKVYRTFEELKADEPGMDLYIAGSDQLWNPQITDKKFDPVYFLNFAGKDARRITYAVGANFDTLPGAEKDLPPLLEGLSAISLRETKVRDAVAAAMPEGTELREDVDPTLLLDKEDYAPLTSKEELEKEPYIFTYSMPNDTQGKVNNAAKLLSEKTGLKVIDASGNPTKANMSVPDHRVCGPDEFLWYMEHAQYVITNSFHGTAFAVIFRKQFAVIPHSQTGNRAMELLAKLRLEKRCCTSGNQASVRVLEPVDYETAEPEIIKYRESSLEYLKRYLELSSR